MSNTGHPNMFPVAGENAVISTREDGKPKPPTEPEVDAAAPAPTNPWANPASFLKHSSAGDEPAAGEPPEGASAPRRTRAEQVIEFLRKSGPTGSARICAALGLAPEAGITPYVASALKSGALIREGRVYLLPEHRSAAASGAMQSAEIPVAPEAPPTVAPATADASASAAETTHPAPPSIASSREPDFTLTSGDALLIAWPDGAVTVQRGGTFVELAAHQARILRVLVEMRK
ncbi:hypothetical protein [Paraburkholderia tropica]|uniref:hypothetical protein n=1 Tax=Paraburkholderia tropica TaxID=92647 RepID=UPI002AB66A6A|nr:hypothetical protein [Paraburkholderia tropica]